MERQPRNLSHHNDEIIEHIDLILDQPIVDIHTALAEAVEKGRMTQDEARECYEAYERTFKH